MFSSLLTQLKEKGLEVLAYADDLVITGKGRKKLKRAIRVTENWADTAKMTINKKKSGVMYLKSRKKKK